MSKFCRIPIKGKSLVSLCQLLACKPFLVTGFRRHACSVGSRLDTVRLTEPCRRSDDELTCRGFARGARCRLQPVPRNPFRGRLQPEVPDR